MITESRIGVSQGGHVYLHSLDTIAGRDGVLL